MTDRRFRHRTRWQLALRYSELPLSTRAVAWALSTWWNPDGEVREIAMPALQEASGAGRSTVKRALEELEQEGWIARHRGGGRHNRSAYAATIPDGAEERLEEVLTAADRRPMQAPLMGALAELTRFEKGVQSGPVSGEKGVQSGPKGVQSGPVPSSPPPWSLAGLTPREWLDLDEPERRRILAEIGDTDPEEQEQAAEEGLA